MRFPVVGGSHPDDEELNTQRSINLYPEADRSSEHKTALISTPGGESWITLDTKPVRNIIKFKGSLIVASGNAVYKVTKGGGVQHLGTLQTSSGHIGMDHNGSEVFIVDDTYGDGYIYDGTYMISIADLDFREFKHQCAVFHDGYFVTLDQETGKWRISSTYAGTAWDGLDWAYAEASPDDLVDVISAKNMLWLFGTETIQPYQNTGNADFPFQTIRAGLIDLGAYKGTPKYMDNNIYWMGITENGGNGVFRLQSGGKAEEVSNANFRNLVEGFTSDDFDEVFANVIVWKNHSWYVLTFPNAQTFGRTLVFDSTVNDWFEWSTKSPAPDAIGKHFGNSHIYFNGEHIIGDDEGVLHKLKDDVFKDGDQEIIRERHMGVLRPGQPISYASLELDIQTGTGTPGTDYTLELTYSNDGGKTFNNSRSKSIGAGGEYMRHVEWTRLGRAEARVFKVKGSPECRLKVRGGWIKANG